MSISMWTGTPVYDQILVHPTDVYMPLLHIRGPSPLYTVDNVTRLKIHGDILQCQCKLKCPFFVSF